MAASGDGQPARAAPAGTALDFDGVDDRVSFGTASGLGVTTFTIETWFKREGTGVVASTGDLGLTGTTSAIPLLTKGRGQSDDPPGVGSNLDMNWFLGIRGDTGVIAVDYEEGAGQLSPSLNHPYSGTTPIVNNTWYHAAATFDGTTLRLYLNGVEEGTGLGGLTGRNPRSDSIQHAALGTAMTSTGATQGFFNGVLDEPRVWNHARSAAQIAPARTLRSPHRRGY